MAFRANMKKLILNLVLGIGLVASTLLPLNAAPPQTSGIVAEITGLPTFVAETHLRIVSSGKGQKVDETIPVFNQTTVQIALKAGTYTLVLVPVSTDGGLSAPPSVPVVVQVERKTFIPVTLAYMPEAQ